MGIVNILTINILTYSPLPARPGFPYILGMIEVHELTKLYGTLPAVSDLSFDVAPGEVLGLVGPNGAGKTTTLRSIAGIIRPTRGRIVIGGGDPPPHPV